MIKSRRIRQKGQAARIGGMINAYGILVGKPERKGLFWRARYSSEDNIKMDLKTHFFFPSTHALTCDVEGY
jgi:hypothetical protein